MRVTLPTADGTLAYAAVSDSCVVTRTHIALQEGDNIVCVTVKGADALLDLARLLIEQAAQITRDERARA